MDAKVKEWLLELGSPDPTATTPHWWRSLDKLQNGDRAIYRLVGEGLAELTHCHFPCLRDCYLQETKNNEPSAWSGKGLFKWHRNPDSVRRTTEYPRQKRQRGEAGLESDFFLNLLCTYMPPLGLPLSRYLPSQLLSIDWSSHFSHPLVYSHQSFSQQQPQVGRELQLSSLQLTNAMREHAQQCLSGPAFNRYGSLV